MLSYFVKLWKQTFFFVGTSVYLQNPVFVEIKMFLLLHSLWELTLRNGF